MPAANVSHQTLKGKSNTSLKRPSRARSELTRLYYEVAEQLEKQKISVAEATREAQQLAKRHPSLSALEPLLHEADEQYWYAPRHSWCLAHVAHVAAQPLAQAEKGPHGHACPPHPNPSPNTSSSKMVGGGADWELILGVTLNTMGQFADAVPLLQRAAERFLAHNQPACAVRAKSELAQAYTYLGDFDKSKMMIAQVKEGLQELDNALANAYCQRSEGLLHLMQNRYHKAATLLRQASEGFMRHNRVGEATLSRCDLAGTLRFVDTEQALEMLTLARAVPSPSNSPLHHARCDHILAFIYSELNRYAESLACQSRARPYFEQEGMRFLVACCDLEQGLAHYRLNQYKKALTAYHQARSYFVAQVHRSYMAICDINIAVTYYAMNRYSEALMLYQQVAEMAMAEKRFLRAARCYTNMGLCYDQVGRYDKALILHDRARQAFIRADTPIYAAMCQENLAGTYRALGRYALALTHYEQAYDTFTAQKLPVYSANCDSQMANLYLAMDQPEKAYDCLDKARLIYSETGLTVYQATCHRLLAQVAHEQQQYDDALAHLQQAQDLFVRQEMIVEVALCHLVEGEVKLAMGDIESAEALFRQAERILAASFPDQAWRAEEGLGQCALIREKKQTAFDHYKAAATLIAQARDRLPTERLSSTFFARREHIFQAAIKLALELAKTEEALALVEACKARSLLNQYGSLRLDFEHDPYLVSVVEQEVTLRQQLHSLRSQLNPLVGQDTPLLNAEKQANMLAELTQLSQSYEEVVDQLRLMTSATPVSAAGPFSIAAFRQVASEQLFGNWCCLTYFLAEDQLLIFSLSADNLEVHSISLTAHDRRILAECVSSDAQRRELIYRGTIRGFAVPTQLGLRYREHLGRLLLPPTFRQNRPDMLILLPHALLHALPFHALFVEQALLLEHVALLYAPSLQILQALWQSSEGNKKKEALIGRHALICGVQEFNERAYPLPHVAREVQAVSQTVGGEVLYGQEVTVAKLKQLSQGGALSHFDLVHFATHAVTESAAPMLSRVLLADDDLTVVDILDLKINAALVTLSSCQAVMGEANAGDEMMSLARAFFYAGAQTVVASLWAVEDEATAIFMQYFYQRLQTGQPIAQALRQTQQAMSRAGYSAYQWAGFIAIGRP